MAGQSGHHPHAHGAGGHVHERLDPAALMVHAQEVCRRAGSDFTPLRRRIFAELAEAGAPLGAYDLVERIGRERRIAPISVYRVLDFLLEVGLVHRIATRNTYLPCLHAHGSHDATVFLVCSRCGSVDEVDAPGVVREVMGTAAATGFRAGGRAVEVEGRCAECQDADPAPPG